ncbi:MAG: nucleotide exchange factor GrpE [Moraxellaceae bacterium]|nr:nucleotide exchange factor GrpE [Moraxellaceae bacterium]
MSEHEQPESTQAVPENAETAAPAESSELDLAARVAELENTVRDTQLRAQAEIQNIHKRAERDVSNAHKFALEKFAGSLLDVVDNLERALESCSDDNEATRGLLEGVALTHKQLTDVLRRFSVEAISPMGETFNPEMHQAVSMQPSTTAAPNTVSAVLAKGYTLSGRLLRPAIVVVATAG